MEPFFFACLYDLDGAVVLVKVEEISGERGCDTLKDVSIAVPIGHVAAHVLDNSVAPVLLDVVVDPADEDVLVAELIHDVVRLIWSFEEDDLGDPFERNFAGDVDLSGGEGTLIICQMRPRMMCYRFSMMRVGVMLMTVQPIDFADSIDRFRFYILW